MNKGIAHIRDGGGAVETAFFLHLADDMLQHFPFVLGEAERFQNDVVALHQLAGGKPQGNAGFFGVVFDEMHNAVKTAVNGAAVVFFIAEIGSPGAFLIFGDVNGVFHQFIDALVFGGGDRYHGNPQHIFHFVDMDGAAVAAHFVHHVQRQNDGNIQLHQLHGQVEAAFDIGGVDDIDDARGLFFQNKTAGNDLFAGIGRERIDSGQIGDPCVGIVSDLAVFAVNGDAGKISHMLIGAGELIEQCGFAAVLIPRQGEGQFRSRGQGVFIGFYMVFTAFAQPRMGAVLSVMKFGRCFGGRFGNLFDFDLFGVGHTQCQFVSVNAEFHGVSHRRVFHQRDFGAGNDAHIKNMLAQRTFAADG